MSLTCKVPTTYRPESRCLNLLDSGGPGENAACLCMAIPKEYLNIEYHWLFVLYEVVLAHCPQKQTNAKTRKQKHSTGPKTYRLLTSLFRSEVRRICPTLNSLSHTQFKTQNLISSRSS